MRRLAIVAALAALLPSLAAHGDGVRDSGGGEAENAPVACVSGAPAPAASNAVACDKGGGTAAGRAPAANETGRAPQPAQRLVTLGGPVTEIVFALGAESEVIATDRTSLYPPRAQKLPSVGVYRALSAEGVLGISPSKILSGSGIGPEEAVKQLRACGIPLVIIENPRSPETLFSAIERLGREVRREKEAAALAAKIRGELEEAKAVGAGRRKPRVVFLMGMAGVASAAGAETQANGIIELAGGENLFARFRGYKPVSEEAILEAAPDVVLIASHSTKGDVDAPKDTAKYMKRFGFRALGSQPKIKVVPVDVGEFLIIGPRAGQCAIKLAKIFHGVDASPKEDAPPAAVSRGNAEKSATPAPF
ncbi:MAG: ABC transporter substrate-binding protein [Puniceicoccales bacterium]|jgi:iron complex transport system substrate-binding protein|nr:ABC transporter substrate-binding protein [Puniceicoccales bacterium]